MLWVILFPNPLLVTDGYGCTGETNKWNQLGRIACSSHRSWIAQWHQMGELQYGDFFTWGETIPKKNFTEENYQHFNQGEYISLTDISDTQYDVAKANWGGTWRMPTKEDFMELMKHCQYKWIMKNGVRGGLFTGHNGNSIFLPAAGLRIESTTENKKSYGCYWLATQDEQYVDFAYAMCFTSGKCFRSSHLCGYGLSIRPVTE